MTDEELIKKYIDEDKQEIALKKLHSGYPVQYIIGNVDFFNCNIIVNESVLIPRFETEYLVQKSIERLEKNNFKNIKALEIGTGSGCISVALKKHFSKNIEIDAIDISEKALKVAKKNSEINNVTINFKKCDIRKFNNKNKYNFIISNPPYVPYNSEVSPNIKFEPQIAIYAENNGLYFYEVILEKIKDNLDSDSFLIAFEIGDKEGELIKQLVQKNIPNAKVTIEKDYNNYERYLFVTK